MYSLTVNFQTLEDLANYVLKQQGKLHQVQIKEEVELPAEIPPVIEEKKTPKKSSKKAAPKVEVEVEVEEDFEEETSPFSQSFDREGAIVTAQKLVAQLKETGIADDKIMPQIHEVYKQADCPINLKISQLDDEQLAVFIPLFEMKVKSITASVKGSKTSASFI
jgi:hypothetical protein